MLDQTLRNGSHARPEPRPAIDHAKAILRDFRGPRQQPNDVTNIGPVPDLSPYTPKRERPLLGLQPRTDVPKQLLAKIGAVDREQSYDDAAHAEALGVAAAQLLHHQLVL